jgi:hypothetical protein
MDGEQADLGSPTDAAALVVAGVDDQSREPRVESIDVAQATQLPPCPDEGVLDSVLGAIDIAKDEEGGSVESVDRPARKRGEGVVVPADGCFDLLALSHVRVRPFPFADLGLIALLTLARQRLDLSPELAFAVRNERVRGLR